MNNEVNTAHDEVIIDRGSLATPAVINIYDRDNINRAVVRTMLRAGFTNQVSLIVALKAEEKCFLKHIGLNSKYRPHVGAKQKAKELRRMHKQEHKLRRAWELGSGDIAEVYRAMQSLGAATKALMIRPRGKSNLRRAAQ